MPTQCSAELFEFARVEKRSVVAAFDGGKITSDAGGLLLGASNRAIGLIERFVSCFTDSRLPEMVEHRCGDTGRPTHLRRSVGLRGRMSHEALRRPPAQPSCERRPPITQRTSSLGLLAGPAIGPDDGDIAFVNARWAAALWPLGRAIAPRDRR